MVLLISGMVKNSQHNETCEFSHALVDYHGCPLNCGEYANIRCAPLTVFGKPSDGLSGFAEALD